MVGRVDELVCGDPRLVRNLSQDDDTFERGLAVAVERCKQVRAGDVKDEYQN